MSVLIDDQREGEQDFGVSEDERKFFHDLNASPLDRLFDPKLASPPLGAAPKTNPKRRDENHIHQVHHAETVDSSQEI